MKKMLIAAGCALLCVLAGCGAEAKPAESAPELEAVPIPARMREEPLPREAAALLKLAEGDELLDWCAGDLDGDGMEDMALMIERDGGASANQRFGKLRELAILMGSNGGYTPGQLSRRVVRWSGQGGMNPEPYNGMSIDESGLTVREWGTKWDEELIFTWQEEGLALTQFVHCNGEWLGSDLYTSLEDRFDLLTGEFTRTGVGESGDRLLFQATLDLPGPWALEDAPGSSEWGLYDALPPLPMREHGPYNPEDHDVTDRLNHTPQEVLGRIHEEQYPDLERVDLPWTEETRAAYSEFLGYPVPDCYYMDGEKKLYYFWLESRYSDGGLLFSTHSVWYVDGDETELLSFNDEEELP